MAHIGLLEDNNRIAKLCVTMLSYAGHDVTVYSNPQECLRALTLLTPRHGQHCLNYVGGEETALPIDVLILDLHLPMMPGLEVLRLLRDCPRTCTLPLIFCTAATTSEINGAFAIAPEATLVEKPFKLQALISAIAEVLPTARQ